MRRPKPGAVLVKTDAYGHETQYESFTCKHCGNPQFVPEGKRLEDVSAVCHNCGLICAACARKGAVIVQQADGSIAEMQRCIPFEKQVEYMEARYRFQREMGIA